MRHLDTAVTLAPVTEGEDTVAPVLFNNDIFRICNIGCPDN